MLPRTEAEEPEEELPSAAHAMARQTIDGLHELLEQRQRALSKTRELLANAHAETAQSRDDHRKEVAHITADLEAARVEIARLVQASDKRNAEQHNISTLLDQLQVLEGRVTEQDQHVRLISERLKAAVSRNNKLQQENAALQERLHRNAEAIKDVVPEPTHADQSASLPYPLSASATQCVARSVQPQPPAETQVTVEPTLGEAPVDSKDEQRSAMRRDIEEQLTGHVMKLQRRVELLQASARRSVCWLLVSYS